MITSSSAQKPGLFTAISIMTLASGIINLFWGFVASAAALGTIVGVVCLPVTILPTILGIFEIIYAAKLMSSQPLPVQASPSIAVFEILTFLYGNIFSMVVGLLNLIFFNDQAVKEYFASINGMQIASPASAIPPTSALWPASSEKALPEPFMDDPSDPKRIRKAAQK